MRHFFLYLVSKSFRKQLFLLAIFLTLGCGLLFFVLNIRTHHQQKIQVPSLKRLQVDEVAQVLSELNLRYEVIDSASFQARFPKKSVLDQFPKAGSFVKEKRKIYLTLNPSQYGLITLPEFYGKTKNEVQSQLRSLGFEIGTLHYVPDLGKDVVRKLLFQEKELESGEKLPRKSLIDLVLGDGNK